MRIWYVPFGELDNKRVVAQHNEWHAIAKLIQQGKAWQGWEKPEHHDAFYDLHTLIAAEMNRRGYNEYTPNYGSRSLRPDTPQVPYPYDPLQVNADRWHLVCRWDGRYRGRKDALTKASKAAYDYLLEEYSKTGCLHDEGTIQQQRLCAVCKRVRWEKGTNQWVPV